MTARLNQDALERFFGLMRQSCGAHTHPEPKVFAQLYRLLSIYSLVKPVRGSNITGGEMLSTLLDLTDLKEQTGAERKRELESRIDNLLTQGDDLDYINDLINEANDHNYLDESIDEFALSYVGGFTARSCSKFAGKCEACMKCLAKPKEDATDEDFLITLKSLGGLTYPTNELKDFLRHLDNQVLKTCKNNELQENILFLVVDALERFDNIPLVGCPDHKVSLSKSIMKYF
ncbi:Transposable element P transposase [Frankliniella fusca]|uniref:Transposable element P transposase n=1 Tax=Frankliniella fusca TaxID=407009 RepID=A0AAE1I2R2_9NEOP|nr:Transposable element P transposase [Frankliniella fusca]